MRFEWDPAKARANRRRHGVDFEDAIRVFGDTARIETLDDREDYGEDRWITIGMAAGVLLVVAYTLRGREGDIIRLISARKASQHEQAIYGEDNG